MRRVHSEETEQTWQKLVAIAGGDPSLVIDAMRHADPYRDIPRLEQIVQYIVRGAA